MSAAGSGVAGTVDGSFFRLPVWVDPRLAPGRTPQTPLGWGKWITNLGLGRSLVMSPNLVWFCISVMLYCCFPYDYGSAAVLDAGWVVRRTVLNLVVMFTYFGFWELALYKWNWSKRKFRGSWYKGEWVNTGWPTAGRLLHNMFFCTLGCLQHTAWEVLICHLHATGKLPYISDEEAFATAGDAVRVVVWCLVVPVWRGCHFYFSHRFIHMRFMYKFVHSLHHRNTDIEPFSGLAMHPIEHVLYYTCHLPSLYFRTHPIHMMFNGIHLLLSPAASHSGWEDHTQSDQFHFLHHAYFECNYGSASVPLDNAFGTFRECIGDSKRYTGEATSTHAAQPPAQSQAEPKQRPVRSYEGLCMKPQRGFGLYMCISVSILALWAAAVADKIGVEAVCAAVELPVGCISKHGRLVAATVAFAPLLVAACMMVLTDRMSPVWPFHKEPVLGTFGFHAVVGFTVGVLPVFTLLSAVLGDEALNVCL